MDGNPINSAQLDGSKNEIGLFKWNRVKGNLKCNRRVCCAGGERDISVPVPAAGVARSASADSGAPRDSADCFEIEDLDDAGWEFVTRPADPLPNGITHFLILPSVPYSSHVKPEEDRAHYFEFCVVIPWAIEFKMIEEHRTWDTAGWIFRLRVSLVLKLCYWKQITSIALNLCVDVHLFC